MDVAEEENLLIAGLGDYYKIGSFSLKQFFDHGNG